MIPKILYSTLTLLLCFSTQTQGTNVAVFHDPANASSVLAVSYINGALQQKGHTVTGRSLPSLATDATNTRIVVALTSSEPTMAHFSNQGLIQKNTMLQVVHADPEYFDFFETDGLHNSKNAYCKMY